MSYGQDKDSRCARTTQCWQRGAATWTSRNQIQQTTISAELVQVFFGWHVISGRRRIVDGPGTKRRLLLVAARAQPGSTICQHLHTRSTSVLASARYEHPTRNQNYTPLITVLARACCDIVD
eukprot:3052242-Rhodomonas_salina.2